MSNLVVMVGAGIISFILVFLFIKAGDKERPHPFLQVLLLGFILACFVFIGKAALDDGDKSCDWLLNQSVIIDNSTNYTYVYSCETLSTTTSNTFFKFTIGILGVVSMYLLGYLVYATLVYFGWIVPSDKSGKGNEGGGV